MLNRRHLTSALAFAALAAATGTAFSQPAGYGTSQRIGLDG